MDELFKYYKEKIIKEFGTKPMYDDEINKYCIKHFRNYGGTFPHDEWKPFNYRSFILNTGNSNSSGIHWIAVYVTRHNVFFFDTFRRNINNIFKDINKKVGGRNIIISKNKIPVQNDNDPNEANICGQCCIAFLHCLNDRGIRDAMLI
jgi:hypothetical protein